MFLLVERTFKLLRVVSLPVRAYECGMLMSQIRYSVRVTASIEIRPIGRLYIPSSSLALGGRLHNEDEKRAWRLADRWKLDEDNYLAVEPEGSDEQDPVLLDSYGTLFITSLPKQDQHTRHGQLAPCYKTLIISVHNGGFNTSDDITTPSTYH